MVWVPEATMIVWPETTLAIAEATLGYWPLMTAPEFMLMSDGEKVAEPALMI